MGGPPQPVSRSSHDKPHTRCAEIVRWSEPKKGPDATYEAEVHCWRSGKFQDICRQEPFITQGVFRQQCIHCNQTDYWKGLISWANEPIWKKAVEVPTGESEYWVKEPRLSPEQRIMIAQQVAAEGSEGATSVLTEWLATESFTEIDIPLVRILGDLGFSDQDAMKHLGKIVSDEQQPLPLRTEALLSLAKLRAPDLVDRASAIFQETYAGKNHKQMQVFQMVALMTLYLNHSPQALACLQKTRIQKDPPIPDRVRWYAQQLEAWWSSENPSKSLPEPPPEAKSFHRIEQPLTTVADVHFKLIIGGRRSPIPPLSFVHIANFYLEPRVTSFRDLWEEAYRLVKESGRSMTAQEVVFFVGVPESQELMEDMSQYLGHLRGRILDDLEQFADDAKPEHPRPHQVHIKAYRRQGDSEQWPIHMAFFPAAIKWDRGLLTPGLIEVKD